MKWRVNGKLIVQLSLVPRRELYTIISRAYSAERRSLYCAHEKRTELILVTASKQYFNIIKSPFLLKLGRFSGLGQSQRRGNRGIKAVANEPR